MRDEALRRLEHAGMRDLARSLPASMAKLITDADLGAPHLGTEVPAAPTAAAAIRSRIRAWAGELGLGDDQTEDIVLAVDEAVSNTIDHAYPDAPGTVTVFAVCDLAAPIVHVIVSDEGSWRPPAPGQRGKVNRGRGLRMMTDLADRIDLQQTDNGTIVSMHWQLR